MTKKAEVVINREYIDLQNLHLLTTVRHTTLLIIVAPVEMLKKEKGGGDYLFLNKRNM